MRILGIIATAALLVGAAIADVNLSQALVQIPRCTVSSLLRLCLGIFYLYTSVARMQRQRASTCAVPIGRPVKLSLHE